MASFDCHANGHTNAATHTVGDIHRHRIDTPSLRGVKGENIRMSIEMNEALIRRGFEEGMNRRNYSVFEEIIDANYVNHTLPAPAPGPEGLKQVLGMFVAAFPDLNVTIEDIIAEGDRVATRGFFKGTHEGVFMGIAPTGKAVKVSYIDIWRIVDGKAVEN